METTRLLGKNELKPGAMKGIEVGDKEILVANVGGTFYAIGNRCTHQGCMLSDGELFEGRVTCSCHGSVFDVTSGKVVRGPATMDEPKFSLVVEDDQILLTESNR